MSKSLPDLLKRSSALRTIAFVDAGQFRPALVANRLGLTNGRRFDWELFKKFLDRVAGGPLLDTHYFDSIEDTALPGRLNFHQFLRAQLGFQLHLSQLKEKQRYCPNCSNTHTEYEQKGVDVGMTISMFKLARAYDQALLCSGDGDFTTLAEFLRDSLGKRVIVLGWANGIAPSLRQIAFCTICLNDYAENFIGDHQPSDAPPTDAERVLGRRAPRACDLPDQSLAPV